jgi:hypothetical protein
LIFEDGLRHSAESGLGILEAFGHSEVTIGVEGRIKACFFFIFHAEQSLMIAEEAI